MSNRVAGEDNIRLHTDERKTDFITFFKHPTVQESDRIYYINRAVLLLLLLIIGLIKHFYFSYILNAGVLLVT